MADPRYQANINQQQEQVRQAAQKDPRKYSVPRVAPPIYQNNPVYENFDQPNNGFGISNFRIEQTLPESINRTSSDIILEDITQYTNPISQFQSERHADFLFSDKYGDYRTIDEDKVPDNYIYWDIIKNFQERNPLMDFFFSKKNLDHLQNLLIQMVKFQSMGQYDITRQNDNELLTIMRAQYISTPSNPFAEGQQFKNEICKLNKNVLDFAVPKILVGIQAYLGYTRDQGSTVYPNARPEYLSSAGQRINKGFDVTFI